MNIHIATLTFSKYVYSNQNLTSLSCSFRGDDFIITCNHPIKKQKTDPMAFVKYSNTKARYLSRKYPII